MWQEKNNFRNAEELSGIKVFYDVVLAVVTRLDMFIKSYKLAHLKLRNLVLSKLELLGDNTEENSLLDCLYDSTTM